MGITWGFLIFLACGAGCLLAWKVYRTNMHIWLPSYLSGILPRRGQSAAPKPPVHVMFLMVDHFEPTKEENVKPWIKRYPEIASRYRDADNRPPRYTWFFPIEQYAANQQFIDPISTLCAQDLGEIELHLHHSDDNEDTLREKLTDGLIKYQRHGVFTTEDGRTAFAFIHGNWALCNSVSTNGHNFCGVNNELGILAELGCFADFTFPALRSVAQPKKINAIYYAADNGLPKPYNDGDEVEVYSKPKGDLMIFQGPLGIDWQGWWRQIQKYQVQLWPRTEAGHVQDGAPPSPRRVDAWVRAGIHVKGRPEWIFVKAHTHGASPKNWHLLLDDQGLPVIWHHLATRYNDGSKYKLHFVTAREAYNIVKAAEMGLEGDPGEFRDLVVKPYKNCQLARQG